MIGHDPERQKEGEEGEDVQKQDYAFSERQVTGEVDVEADRQEQEKEEKQRDLPGCNKVSVRIDEEDHGLDEPSQLIRACRNPRDPAKTTAPTDDIRERSLVLSRCEFGDPVCGNQQDELAGRLGFILTILSTYNAKIALVSEYSSHDQTPEEQTNLRSEPSRPSQPYKRQPIV